MAKARQSGGWPLHGDMVAVSGRYYSQPLIGTSAMWLRRLAAVADKARGGALTARRLEGVREKISHRTILQGKSRWLRAGRLHKWVGACWNAARTEPRAVGRLHNLCSVAHRAFSDHWCPIVRPACGPRVDGGR
jgi:hypothetical protein